MGGGADEAYGGVGNDKLYGGDANDILDGGTGNDTMDGGEGSDSYVADVATDVVTGIGTSGTDLLTSAVSWTLGATLENLTLTATATLGTGNASNNAITGNAQANTLTGNDGDDSLYGGNANDSLVGGAGNDSMNGGTGADSLTGGGGADQFVCKATSESTSASQDSVADFNHSQADKFDLTGIDAKSDGTSNDAFSFITTAFTGHTGELRVTTTTGGVLIEGDTNGDKTADLVIFVAGATSIVVGDFLL